MLYASLATSLFSAFLAMLGKQWLSRYSSIDVRGTAIERSRERQRKLDGMITWYFDLVMESLPLMLQVSLLLLGCAMSQYLWGINLTVACVVLGFTVLGVAFYAFIIIAGAASVSCPYQTPAAHRLRHILHHTLPHILGLLHSAFLNLIDASACINFFPNWWYLKQQDLVGKISALLKYIVYVSLFLAYDTYQFIWALVRVFIGFTKGVYSQLCSAHSSLPHGLGQQIAILDLQCISWVLRMSLNKDIHLSTLKFLITRTTLANFTSTLVLDCFNILTGCIKVKNHNLVVAQGLEQLAEASAVCFFCIYSHLLAMDPTSSVLADVRQHYARIFPPNVNFTHLPFLHIYAAIHRLLHAGISVWKPIEWRSYKPSNYEYIAVAHTLAKLSQFEYQRRQHKKVPRWLLHFALHSLSQGTLLPTSVIYNCLIIIAIDLGCNIPNNMDLEERYIYI